MVLGDLLDFVPNFSDETWFMCKHRSQPHEPYAEFKADLAGWPAGKVTSLPRATSTAGCVQKGLASCGMVTPASLMISAQDTACWPNAGASRHHSTPVADVWQICLKKVWTYLQELQVV